jgi:hypothetical protein
MGKIDCPVPTSRAERDEQRASDDHHDELDRDGSDGGRSSAQAPFREADEDHEHQERDDVARRLQGIQGPGNWCPPSPVLEGGHSVGDAVQ